MYASIDEVKFWSQHGTSDLGTSPIGEDEGLTLLINAADKAIEDYTDQPRGFFEPGGVNIQNEYHDGVDVGHHAVYFFQQHRKPRPKLRLDYTPVLSVTTLEHQDSAGNWTTYTEGRTNDYFTFDDGVRYIKNLPRYDYKNIRVSYVAGYAQTPGRVSECSARLAAALHHLIVDSKKRATLSTQGTTITTPPTTLATTVFTRGLKELVRRYKRRVPAALVT